MTLPIKLIKLSNGDSLVAKIDVNEDKEYATIKQLSQNTQMDVTSRSEAGGAYENATFGPWESFQMTKFFTLLKERLLP